ncbi:MAG: alpha/beta hydrolase [Methanomassiliicoccaceae archaeon]|jgi:pimeloyl-ACP methyl ester carboxylesterase|nr:alpha/beta hydrolase [Methanomassiliicoccaceae archaeon]
MPIADINGQKIHYEVTGEGTPVVLIAGFATEASYWDVLTQLLPNHKVITMDNRGVGRTKYKGKFDIFDLTDDLTALLDRLSIFRAHIVGWSMGGCIAQEFTLKHPERVISLTLISPYLRRPSRSSFAMRAAIKAVREGADIETVAMFMQVMCFPEPVFLKKEGKAEGGRRPFGATIEGVTDQMDAVDSYDSRERVSGISVPALCIHGQSDIMVPPEVGDQIASLIKGCRLYRVPGAGHIINPATYYRTMLDHFKENE